jgi:hypothetical protein
MNFLHIHWGFIVGGVSRYVQALERLSAEHGVRSHSLCILDSRWQTDAECLSSLEHTRIPIRGRLDRSWIGPVRISNNVMIGCNAVVTRDIPDEATAVGIPARVVNYRGSHGTIHYRKPRGC